MKRNAAVQLSQAGCCMDASFLLQQLFHCPEAENTDEKKRRGTESSGSFLPVLMKRAHIYM
jgi:hypothetical protein